MGGRRPDELDGVLEQLEPRLGRATAGPVLLKGGITNHNYLVRFAAMSCVVRIAGRHTSLLGIDRDAERIANETAAELGLAPRVLASDERWLVTEFIEASPGEPVAVREVAETVGRALRRFHESRAALPARFWVPELLDAYGAVVRERGAGCLTPTNARAS